MLDDIANNDMKRQWVTDYGNSDVKWQHREEWMIELIENFRGDFRKMLVYEPTIVSYVHRVQEERNYNNRLDLLDVEDTQVELDDAPCHVLLLQSNLHGPITE